MNQVVTSMARASRLSPALVQCALCLAVSLVVLVAAKQATVKLGTMRQPLSTHGEAHEILASEQEKMVLDLFV